MSKSKKFVAILKHDSSADPYIKTGTYDKCVKKVHDFFLGYGFEMIDGKPFDSGNDDGAEGGFKCFSNVKIHNGNMASFTHCDGDGPVATIQES